MHFLGIFEKNCKPHTSDDFDQLCTAEIPCPNKFPGLHKKVKSFMLHSKCGTTPVDFIWNTWLEATIMFQANRAHACRSRENATNISQNPFEKQHEQRRKEFIQSISTKTCSSKIQWITPRGRHKKLKKWPNIYFSRHPQLQHFAKKGKTSRFCCKQFTKESAHWFLKIFTTFFRENDQKKLIFHKFAQKKRWTKKCQCWNFFHKKWCRSILKNRFCNFF